MDRHPYRTPIEVLEALDAPPTAGTLRLIDDYCLDLRRMILTREIDGVPHEALASTVDGLNRFRRHVTDGMVGGKIYLAAGSVVSLALIPFVLRLIQGAPGVVTGLLLLAFATALNITRGAVARAEAVGARIAEAVGELSRHVVARSREEEVDPVTGVRVDVSGGSAVAQEALSETASQAKQKGTP